MNRGMGAEGRRFRIVLVLLALQVTFQILDPPLGVLHGANVLVTLALAHTTWKITGRRTDFWVLLVAGSVPAILDLMVPWEEASLGLNEEKEALWLLFPAFLAYRISGAVYGSDEITSDEVAGAVAVYLLLGLFFANVYELFFLLDPTSITWGANFGGGSPSFGEFLYFSFITLATVGFGDVAPAHPLTRGTVVLEAVTGLLYLTILVARLVSQHGTAAASAHVRSGVRRAAQAKAEGDGPGVGGSVPPGPAR